MKDLERLINYQFNNKQLLKRALSHTSYCNEVKSAGESNERLEFLGDSVLSVVVAEYLFSNYKKQQEGDLTKLRASLVCEKALAQFAKEIELGRFIMLGRGEQQNGGSERPSILSDAFEALLAAMYLDGGMAIVRPFILKFVEEELERIDKTESFHDYKTQLQEIIQRNREEELLYVLVAEEGPDHDKRFTIEVRLNSNVIGKGIGHSKKQAEQLAAKQALQLMGQDV